MGTAIIGNMPIQSRFVQFCDFCGASEKEAKILIASPNGNHICNECVSECVGVLQEIADERATVKKEER